jgi:8-oxo-dGTP diphosphatase
MTQHVGSKSTLREVAAAVITKGELILTCCRPPGGPHGGKWEFPGGKREQGETIEDCLRRELKEELNIDAEIGAEIWRTTHCYPGQLPIRLVFFHVQRYSGPLHNHTFAKLAWLPIPALAELDFLEADRRFIDRLAHNQIWVPQANR